MARVGRDQKAADSPSAARVGLKVDHPTSATILR
jgi:hypothetical protein